MQPRTFTFCFIQVWLELTTPVSCPHLPNTLEHLEPARWCSPVFQLNSKMLYWSLVLIIPGSTECIISLRHSSRLFLMWQTEAIRCRLSGESVMRTDLNMSVGECQGFAATTVFKPAPRWRRVCECTRISACTHIYNFLKVCISAGRRPPRRYDLIHE